MLPGLADTESYSCVRGSLALSFALLGLAETFTISSFHPRDTYQITVDEEGSRSWEMSLPHPLVHLVLKKPPEKR